MRKAIYIILVREYDFTSEDGTPDYVPTHREMIYLFSPFTVWAETPEDAISDLSDRTGWCIAECEFLYPND